MVHLSIQEIPINKLPTITKPLFAEVESLISDFLLVKSSASAEGERS